MNSESLRSSNVFSKEFSFLNAFPTTYRLENFRHKIFDENFIAYTCLVFSFD